MSPVQSALDYAQARRQAFMDGFTELLRIPSVSTDPSYKSEVERCAAWVAAEMTRVGLKNARVIPTTGHPVVYGEWLEAGADKPTVLIYAHYDVQPVDPLDLWVTPPFEPTLREGKLYARGAVDDKAGVFVNLKALESIFAVDGALPVNVKVFFEGEEESGSPNMLPFVAANQDLLHADLLVLCDGEFNREQPRIVYAGRGIVGAQVELTGADHDLHSGVYGGVVHNPLHLAGKIIGSFHDADGRVQIPGFYDPVRALSDAERANLEAMFAQVSQLYQERSGAQHFWANSLAPVPVRAAALPTLDVNGVWGGYQGPGMKTVIPSKAGFKVTMRLVNDQDPAVIAEAFKQYVLGFATDTVTIEVSVVVQGYPFSGLFEGAAVDAVQNALMAVIGKRALLERSGGSIPIAGMFQQHLGIPMTHLGLGAGDNIHSPNEFIIVEDYYAAIDTAIHFLYNAAAL